MNSSNAGILFVCFTVFAIAQLTAGFMGIEHQLGLFWAWLALGAAVLVRFTLPITIGAFFGAMKVWGWHWFFAALFAAPGLIFVVPGLLAAVVAMGGKAMSSNE